MTFSDLELPSNRKFGVFFTAFFTLVAAYLYLKSNTSSAVFFAGFAIGTGLITLIKDSLLIWPNRLWMALGYLLGRIVSPLVLGILFFLLFTPIALVTRLFGRDELRLKPSSHVSHWKPTEPKVSAPGFEQQF